MPVKHRDRKATAKPHTFRWIFFPYKYFSLAGWTRTEEECSAVVKYSASTDWVIPAPKGGRNCSFKWPDTAVVWLKNCWSDVKPEKQNKNLGTRFLGFCGVLWYSGRDVQYFKPEVRIRMFTWKRRNNNHSPETVFRKFEESKAKEKPKRAFCA